MEFSAGHGILDIDLWFTSQYSYSIYVSLVVNQTLKFFFITF